MFSKALGNGYAICAVLGKRSVMECAQQTFIGSTFWTERIGPTAALKTLEVMEEEKSWEQITEIGTKVTNGWKEIAKNNRLDISVTGLPSVSNFTINSPNFLTYKTYITQEMLKKGFLAGSLFYACTKHAQDIVEKYLAELDSVFSKINECERVGNQEALLEDSACDETFKRLN